MVKSLRYWLQAVGLTFEPTNGKKEQKLTPIGEIISDNDPYIEEIGTLWILHYCLVNNKESIYLLSLPHDDSANNSRRTMVKAANQQS